MSLLSDMSPGGLKDSGETDKSSNLPTKKMIRSFKDKDKVCLGQEKHDFHLKLLKKKKFRKNNIYKKEVIKVQTQWFNGKFEDSYKNF